VSARRYRQRVLNVLLAQLLHERGVISAPENILQWPEARRMSDVLVDYAGLRTSFEGEVDDQVEASAKALACASKRVEQGIAQIALAIAYPASLRFDTLRARPNMNSKLSCDATANTLRSASRLNKFVIGRRLKERLAHSELQVGVVTEAGPSRYTSCNVDGLGEILRRAFDQLIQEDVVSKAVAVLEAGMEIFAQAVAGSPGASPQLAAALGVHVLPSKKSRAEGANHSQGKTGDCQTFT
jgi:hypothetical protein